MCKVLRCLKEAEIEKSAHKIQSALFSSSVPGVEPVFTKQAQFVLREFCSYPLCRDRTGHTITVCPLLHARCAACKCRGHRAESEESEKPHHAVCPEHPAFPNKGKINETATPVHTPATSFRSVCSRRCGDEAQEVRSFPGLLAGERPNHWARSQRGRLRAPRSTRTPTRSRKASTR